MILKDTYGLEWISYKTFLVTDILNDVIDLEMGGSAIPWGSEEIKNCK
jgi:hypothetical protein